MRGGLGRASPRRSRGRRGSPRPMGGPAARKSPGGPAGAWLRAGSALKHQRVRVSGTPAFQRVFQRGVSEGCFGGVSQRGVSEGCFRGEFQRGVSEGCFRPLGGSPERLCVMHPGGHFVKIRLPEGHIGQETGTARFLVRNQCRRWPRRPCGQLGVFIFNDDVGKTSFPRGVFQRGVSEVNFRGVSQRGVSDPLA